MVSQTAAIEMSAVKGVQAGAVYYSAMCPIEFVVKLFKYNDESLPPEMRSQRILNKARIPEIRDYILENPTSYIFSALTASIDGEFDFISQDSTAQVGILRIGADSQIIVNDGQHRRQALIEALKQKPELRSEHIVIVFYRDQGLVRSQQMFSDLNKHAVKPTRSLSLHYDSRDPFNILLKSAILEIPIFKDKVEICKATISNRSKNVFTLSGISNAAKLLTSSLELEENQTKEMIVSFFNACRDKLTEWKDVICGTLSPVDLRKGYVSGHAVFIKALGIVGNTLFKKHGEAYLGKLTFLSKIDFQRNSPLLQGVVMNGKRIGGADIYINSLSKFILKNFEEEAGDK